MCQETRNETGRCHVNFEMKGITKLCYSTVENQTGGKMIPEEEGKLTDSKRSRQRAHPVVGRGGGDSEKVHVEVWHVDAWGEDF